MTTTVAPTGAARFNTHDAARYHQPSSTGRDVGSGRPSSLRTPRRTSRESIRSPRSISTAGVITSDVTAAITTTPSPAYAKERRKYIGKIASAASARATVTAENATVRPAVCIVRKIADALSRPSATSSRYRVTSNSV